MAKNNWQKIGQLRRAGMLVPLFSVYSKNSIGMADFSDIKLLTDLAAKCGSSILQLLPMNEVSFTFCPYDAISSFALEPLYISLNDLAVAKKSKFKSKILYLKNKFPTGEPYVNYDFRQTKERLLRKMFEEERASLSSEFNKFVKENGYWLEDFALFKVLKAHHDGWPWYSWKEGYKNRDGLQLDIFKKQHEKDIDFQKWMQWICFEQFKKAKSYAASKGVLVMGDLPILISRDSSDVWAHPEYFKLDFAAGAPPDMYCAKGQRWGMPTYDWEKIAADGYAYLRNKLKFAENFYDILRVDHVVGLFRIWSIPYNDVIENEGLNGSFDPKDENLWAEHGKSILSVMCESTSMLLCAEDLGMIPKACPETLKEFGIPGNDVQRWTKDWSVKHDFLEPKEYRTLSVAMLSTHDTTNWAAWWENEAGTVDEALFIKKCEDRGISCNYVKEKLFDPRRSKHGRLRWRETIDSAKVLISILGKKKEDLADFVDLYENTYGEKEKLWKHLGLKGQMREKSDHEMVQAALDITSRSESAFCIELIIDLLYPADIFKGDAYKYRINRPGTIARDNWSLTVPIPIDKLISHKVCKTIKDMVKRSGRI